MKNYWKIKDQWIVIEGSPHPDDFIAVMAPGWDGQTLVDHSLFPSKQKTHEVTPQLLWEANLRTEGRA